MVSSYDLSPRGGGRIHNKGLYYRCKLHFKLLCYDEFNYWILPIPDLDDCLNQIVGPGSVLFWVLKPYEPK